jgi:hypothetical protein
MLAMWVKVRVKPDARERFLKAIVALRKSGLLGPSTLLSLLALITQRSSHPICHRP